jgi:BirA family biotin operon repressor/biotin-[acetyl-CoA-carboxylase] ligase
MTSWQKIVSLDSIDSTNNYFSKILKEQKYPEGSIITTSFQASGKGQGNNSWESEKGKNLLCSLVLFPKFLPIDKNFLLSKVVSLGIAHYLETKTTNIKIKWPNDIYVNDKKIAGILIENIIKGSIISQCIVGIGLNFNQTHFTSDAPNPVSLKQLTGDSYSIKEELTKLRDCIQHFYKKLINGEYKEINKEYIKTLYRFNDFFYYKIDNKSFKAKITGVNEYGHLQIIDTNHITKEYEFKEIEFII